MRCYFSASIILALVTILIFGSGPGQRELRAEQVTYQLGWLVNAFAIPFITAIDKGYFKENGLEVNILPGQGAAATATNVDQVKVDFGSSETPAIILGRSKGMKVKAVGMLHATTPSGFAALKESGISKPKDFEGRRLGLAPGGTAYSLLPIFLRINGVDAKKVKMVNLAPAAYTPSLLEKRIDIIGSFEGSNLPVDILEARKMGKEISWMPLRDYGLDIYTSAIAARDRLIQEKPDLIRRFVRASFKGVEYSLKNPAEALEVLIRYYPLMRKAEEALKLGWDQISPHYENVPGKGYGWIKEEKMKQTYDIVVEAYSLKEPPPLQDIYTNNFLAGPAK